MKRQILTLTFLLIIFCGCNSNKKSKEVASYTYQENVVTSKATKLNVGEWVKEGTICYGLVVAIDKSGKAITGQPVKAKVIKISESEIKMKSLENISKSRFSGKATLKDCPITRVKKGEIWIEKEGDLFKTREEAINFLKEKKLYSE